MEATSYFSQKGILDSKTNEFVNFICGAMDGNYETFVKILTHDDLDGVGCKIVSNVCDAEINIDDLDTTIIPMDNDRIEKWVKDTIEEFDNCDENDYSFALCIISDLCLPEGVLRLIADANIRWENNWRRNNNPDKDGEPWYDDTILRRIFVMDHHGLSCEKFEDDPRFPFSMQSVTDGLLVKHPVCGTWLVNEFWKLLEDRCQKLHSDDKMNAEMLKRRMRIDEFTHHVLAYDTHTFNEDGDKLTATLMNKLFWLMGQDEFADIVTKSLDLEKTFDAEIPPAILMIAMREISNDIRKVKAVAKRAVKQDITFEGNEGTFRAVTVVTEERSLAMRLGEHFGELYPDRVCLIVDPAGRKFQFRSAGDTSSRDLAIMFGGGGHLHAAGATPSRGVFRTILDSYYSFTGREGCEDTVAIVNFSSSTLEDDERESF